MSWFSVNSIVQIAGIFTHRSHLRFNHRCLSSEILPISLRTKPLTNTKEERKLAKKFGMQNLRLSIHMSHERIRLCNKKLNSLSYQLQAELEGFFLKVQQHLSVIDETTQILQTTQILLDNPNITKLQTTQILLDNTNLTEISLLT